MLDMPKGRQVVWLSGGAVNETGVLCLWCLLVWIDQKLVWWR